MRESCHGVGHVLVQVMRDGNEICRREGRNQIVQNGFALLANRLFTSTGPARVRYMQLGHSGAAATTAQTQVLTPLSSAALAGRQTVVSVAMSGARTAKWQYTWLTSKFSATGVEEVGLFAATSALTSVGTLFARFVFTPVNKTNSDTLKISWTTRIS